MKDLNYYENLINSALNVDAFSYNIEKLLALIADNSSIGIHELTTNTLDINTIADLICEEGLKTDQHGGLLSNVEILGQIEDENISDKILSYSGPSNKNRNAKIIISFPKTIFDRDGNEYFLGSYIQTYKTSIGANRGTNPIAQNMLSLPISKYVSLNKVLPKELIVGYLIEDSNENTIDFLVNPNYFGLSEENRNKLTDNLIKSLSNDTMLRVDTSEEEINRIQNIYKQMNINISYYNEILEYKNDLKNRTK